MADKKSKITDNDRIAKLEKIVSEMASDEHEQVDENNTSPYIVHNYRFPENANTFAATAGGTVLSRKNCQVKEIYRNDTDKDVTKDVRLDYKAMNKGWANVFSADSSHKGDPHEANPAIFPDATWEQGDSGLTQPVKVKANESIFFHYNDPKNPQRSVKFSWTVT